MMDIRYVNSRGQEINLVKEPYLLLSSNTLFNYEWSYDTFNNSYIGNFRKGIKTPDIQIKVSGKDYKDFLDNLNIITDILDHDNLNEVFGRLYFNGYYMKCNIKSNTKPNKFLLRNYCILSLSLVSDEPNWYMEQMTDITINSPAGTSNLKEYDYDYSVDYMRSAGLDGVFNNPFNKPVDTEITIYGEMKNLDMVINGNHYKVNCTIESGARLIINTLEKTITLIHADGRIENAFKYRDSKYYTFNKISGGDNSIYWNSNTDVSIKLIDERGEPRWEK